MFRTITTNSIKQGQRTSAKAFQITSTNPATQTQTRLLNTFDQTQPYTQRNHQFSDISSNKKYRNNHRSNKGSFVNSRGKYYSTNATVTPASDLNTNLNNHSIPSLLMEFDECLSKNSTYDLTTGVVNSGLDQFWSATYRIIPLYRQLVPTGELSEERLAEFVSLLRNGLRINRLQLSKLTNNIDKDAQDPLKMNSQLLTVAIREVSYNVLDGLISLNPHGLTHLFKAYKDLGLSYEAVHIWQSGIQLSYLNHSFTSEPVLGAVFPFLVEFDNINYDEILEMYERIKNSKGENEKIHNELQVGMIRVCLFTNRTITALDIFKQLSSDVYSSFTSKNIEPPINVKSYMTMAHLSFIGYCRDIDTANVFFNDAIAESMPYPTPLQLNFIKRYLTNIYEVTGDYYKVKEIWLKTWEHYEMKQSSNPSVSSSLNDSFLSIFFNQFSSHTMDSQIELNDILSRYANIRKLDEPFFNVLLSKSTVWKSADVFDSILAASDSFGLEKTNVFYRCALKACGSIDVQPERILDLFRQLLKTNNRAHYSGIAHPDWMALRDATVNSKIFQSLSNESKSKKIDLYFKLWKLCSPYFLRIQNFKIYIQRDVLLDPNYSRIFQQINYINASDISIPELEVYSKSPAIDAYTPKQYTR